MQKFGKFLVALLTPICYGIAFVLGFVLFASLLPKEIQDMSIVVPMMIYIIILVIIGSSLYGALISAGYIEEDKKYAYKVTIISQDNNKENLTCDTYEYTPYDIDHTYVQLILDGVPQLIPKTSTILITDND